MPEDLRAKLEESAKSGARSLHAEIVARLEASFAHHQSLEIALDQGNDLLRTTLESRLITHLLDQSYAKTNLMYASEQLEGLKEARSSLERLERRAIEAELATSQRHYDALQRSIDEVYKIAERYGIHLDPETLMNPSSIKRKPGFQASPKKVADL